MKDEFNYYLYNHGKLIHRFKKNITPSRQMIVDLLSCKGFYLPAIEQTVSLWNFGDKFNELNGFDLELKEIKI